MPDDSTVTLLGQIDAYVERLFTTEDPALRTVGESMHANNLVRINVSPNLGHLIYLIARLSGARRILEIGTLGGYSASWLALAAGPTGQVITLEADPRHAEVARAAISRTELANRIEVRLGDGQRSMNAMIEQGTPPFDLIFIDANKDGYPAYLDAALRLARSGTVILADNVIRDGDVIDSGNGDEGKRAIQRFNETLAADSRLEALIIPTLGRGFVDGIAVARVR
jgi:predicted O-methyltransferase YrrM